MQEGNSAPSPVGTGALLILPTYNERENIKDLLESVFGHAPGINVLVIDDGSPDSTGEIALEFSRQDPRVKVMERGAKMGLGTAYVAGFHHALAHDYGYVLTMDSDFSHHPRYLPSVLARAAEPGVDIAIGSRYVPGGAIEGWGPHRHLLSWGANTFARTLLRLTPRDCTGGYRCYNRRVLEGLELDSVVSHGYSALLELLWHCNRAGYRVGEVPITFVDRERGTSKISRGEIVKGLTTVLRLAGPGQHRRQPRGAGSASRPAG
jgi:glycosyltransferase involved in cell wall biosynthesis